MKCLKSSFYGNKIGDNSDYVIGILSSKGVTCSFEEAHQNPKIHLISSLFMISALFFLTLVSPVFAQTANPPVPDNARQKSYGDGWECDLSFRLVAGECISVVAPENAYATMRAYGSGWECNHGFIEVEDTSCKEILIPKGGYLDSDGIKWRCSRGYFKIDDTCERIILPEHDFLSGDIYSPSWSCERGFTENDGACKAIDLPENAHLSRAGNRWECNRNFERSSGECTLRN